MSSREVCPWPVLLCLLLVLQHQTASACQKKKKPTAAPVTTTPRTISVKKSCHYKDYTWSLKNNEKAGVDTLGCKELNLSRNKLTSVRLAIFTRLEELGLEKNRLDHMPAIPAATKAQIRWFFIAGNEISEIPRGYFSDFHKLSVLSFQQNRITSISKGNSLTHLPNLYDVMFDQLNCTDCTTLNFVKELTTIKSINLLLIMKSGKSTDFPCSGDLSNKTIKKLGTPICITNIYVCKYTPRDLIHEPPKVKLCDRITMPGAKVKNILPNTFKDLSYLLQIVLINVSMETFSTGAIVNCPNIEWIVLGINKIEQIPTFSLGVKYSLQVLYLNFNKITAIRSGQLVGFRRLKHLRLEGNPITQIDDDAIGNLPQLQYLIVSMQPSPYFEYEKCGCHLYAIGLFGGTISEFPDLKPFKNLSLIGLEKTNIKKIAFDKVAHLKFLKIQHFENNDFDCEDCETRNSLIKLVNVSETIRPVKRGNCKVKSMTLEMLQPCDTPASIPAPDTRNP